MTLLHLYGIFEETCLILIWGAITSLDRKVDTISLSTLFDRQSRGVPNCQVSILDVSKDHSGL